MAGRNLVDDKKYHYTYRITNKIKNKHYYGVRSSNIKPKEDIGIKYFSSSTDQMFMNDQKENTHNYKYKVVKVFSTRKEAEIFETYLHEKFNVQINESFYNKAKNTLMGFSVEGRKQSPEHKAKITLTKVGKVNFKNIITGETGRIDKELFDLDDNLITLNKGISKSEETRAKISKAKTGINLSEEHKRNIGIGSSKNYENKEFYNKFCKVMDVVNKNPNKIEKAKETIKHRWENDIEFIERMKLRKSKPKKKILVINPDGVEFIYAGFEDLIKEFNFNATMVRKSLKDGLPCLTKTKNYNEKTKNTLNYIFKETIDENKKN